jgi:hypothetical protein
MTAAELLGDGLVEAEDEEAFVEEEASMATDEPKGK